MGRGAQPYIAEFIATFTLCFIGIGAIAMNSTTARSMEQFGVVLTGLQLGLVGIALAHGFAIMVMVYATGHISGAHINPAVTFGMLLAGRIGLGKALGYVFVQLAGASLGALLISLLYPLDATTDTHLGATMLASNITPATGVGIEAVLTFLLVFVIFGVAVDGRAPAGAAGLAIGGTIVLDILAAGPLTGASMNPARSFGPALVQMDWANHWVYWAGPLGGGAMAAWVYALLLQKRPDAA